MTLKLPNSPLQGSDKAIFTLHLPEKATASHDVATEIALVKPKKGPQNTCRTAMNHIIKKRRL